MKTASWTGALSFLISVCLMEVPASGQSAGGDTPLDAPLRVARSGPMTAPLTSNHASDEVFGTYVGEDLDQYLFDSSSPLEFTIDVDRVFTRQSPALTDWNRLLISQPELVLRVYDVDESPCGRSCCEVDKVYLNDHYLGDLTGANNTWSVVRFEIPVQWFELGWVRTATYVGPGEAPVPGTNRVRIDIDTACDHDWAVECDFGELKMQAMRPALLLHGILSNGETWEDFQSVFLGGLTEVDVPYPLDRAPNLGPNAFNAGLDLMEALRGFGVDRINLVGHSNGGLVAHLVAWTHAEFIESIVTLGSPLQGTELADHLLRFHPLESFMLGGILRSSTFSYPELTTWFREEHYRNFPHAPPGIGYSFMAGNPRKFLVCPFDYPLPSVIFTKEHDWVVPVSRATPPWAAGADRIQSLNHLRMTGSAALADWVADRLIAGTNCLSASTDGGGGDASGGSAAAATIDSGLTSPSEAPALSHRGIVPSSGRLELPIVVDRTVKSLSALGLSDAGANGLSLISPTGETYTGSPLTVDSVWEGTDALSARVNSPERGTWQLILTAPVASESSVEVHFDSKLQLVLSIDDAAPQRGQAIEVRAHLRGKERISNVEVTAEVLDLDGGLVDSLVFEKTGARRYRADWLPSVDGPVLFRALAAGAVGKNRRKTPFQREAGLPLTIVPAAAAAPSVVAEAVTDDNFNGLIDALQLTVQYQAPQLGDYWLSGTLAGPSSVAVVTASRTLAGVSGNGQATLEFSGRTLRASGVDGPYDLLELRLIDVGTATVCSQPPTPYQTDDYQAIDFEGPFVVLADHAVDRPEDLDGDGDYDRLVVRIGARVADTYSGWYSYNALLVAGDGSEVQWVAGNTSLDSELTELVLTYDGTLIAEADGPYRVINFSIHPTYDQETVFQQPEIHVTRPYRRCWFEGAQVGCPIASPAFSLEKGTVVHRKRGPGKDRFTLKGRIDGLADLEQADISVRLNDWFELLPAGSLVRKNNKGRPYWIYKSSEGEIRKLKIWPRRSGSFQYVVEAAGIDLAAFENPALFGLELGNTSGVRYFEFKRKETRSLVKYVLK